MLMQFMIQSNPLGNNNSFAINDNNFTNNLLSYQLPH